MPVVRTLDWVGPELGRWAQSPPPFRGDAVSLHISAIEHRRRLESIDAVLADTKLVDQIRSVVLSWGMTRHPLASPDRIRAAIERNAEALSGLWTTRLEDVRANERDGVAITIWAIISDIGISSGATQLVAGSKFLHHLLPDLVPPIDRAYTGNFFYARDLPYTQTNGRIQYDQPRRWREMFTDFTRFAAERAIDLNALVDRRWQSSLPKVIDNAIIGFVRNAQGK